ncbi:mitochondrial assembly of ribosomal large subunit protein 1 isoform X2 [Megalobrama amblycephala]|uniref:mitochondrial assembly of ribosomal large subunit protein 1 isoform X2 n=1 Tax=Megalobrama amblycephala TaxID=75352 RepID=UPI0020143DDF|nr:mitochondrial assembly of ribosomal large subunit protein 1 isoform X2 [Megalobrama amblycephala]
MIAARCLLSKAPHRTVLRAAGSRCYRPLQQKDTHAVNHRRTQTHNLTITARDITTPGFDVALLVSLLRQENASDICVIRVPPELKYTDHMIIVSGSSPRHLNAMAEFVLKAFKFLRKDEERHVRLEGRDCDDWKCIDFGPMVLHFMLPDTRDTYELEKLWTLRSYDEQLNRIPRETLPSDFIYDMKHK